MHCAVCHRRCTAHWRLASSPSPLAHHHSISISFSSPSPSPSHCAPVYRRLTRLPQYHYSLASRSSTDILLPRKSSPLPNSTMAEREPRSIHMSRDWSNLPSDILDLCCSCMDMLSALRLAACSRDMHTAIVEARPKLFKTPCLLLSGLARLAHHDTEAYMMPLDFNPISISRNFFASM